MPIYILSLVTGLRTKYFLHIVNMGIDKRATLLPPLTTCTCNKNCKNIFVQTMYVYLCRF